ncbi:VWA domain-containing protein [Fulvivirgaceae bacterium BMA12]|uniref:VWA domain-containing protein n=1 Tax=Agaribacillus aureus TaxID=3051825 RepID=A0ABT8LI10_9BACT|nr:VWA domain-containing protein [Fulvivirgaceae bacterium BMA12]
MVWSNAIGLLEVLFIAAFIVFYGIYLIKVISAAKRLKSPFYAVFYKVAIRTVFFVLLIVALLGPSFGESVKEIKVIGKDIYFAVDLSGSMNAHDIQPTRLEKIKFELKHIVDEFSSDRVGLIIFSSEAFVQCPLTYDQSAFSLFLETLNTNLVPNAGTDFGSPLKIALKKFSEESEDSPVTQPKSKIIILISDGEDFGEETAAIAEKIEKQGIKLFSLGVGTERGSKIRVRGGFKRDKYGKEIVSKLNPTSLKQIASITGGKYFEINGTRNDVSRLINTIDNIEGEVRDTKKMDVSANKYFYFLGLALILFVLDFLTRFKTLRI